MKEWDELQRYVEFDRRDVNEEGGLRSWRNVALF
jgi:hypothetical protein